MHYREPSKSVKGAAVAATIGIVAAVLAAAACSSDEGREADRRLAESFLRSSPTFQFDGNSDSVELRGSAEGDCKACFAFTFGFESSHPGYGDRAALTLAAVATLHEAVIVIEDGLVVAARIDSIWDVIAQRPIVQVAQARHGPDRPDEQLSVLLDSPFELQVGQEAVVGSEDLKITFVDVSEDSRCPAATNCGAFGHARVHIDVVAGERRLGLHEFVLAQRTVRGTAKDIGRYVVSMRELNPYPGTESAPYAAIFVVSKVVVT